jgi:hypothetical protein
MRYFINTRLFSGVIGVFFLLLGLANFGLGSVVIATGVTQGYEASEDLQKGSVVSVDGTKSKVVKSNTSNDQNLAGVVVDSSSGLVGVQPAGSQVSVATSGDVEILVSTANGDIKKGDRLIASPISGVAALDHPPAPGVKYIAVAEADFTSQSQEGKSISVELSSGGKREVRLGLIRAKLLLGNRTPGSGQDQNILTNFGKKIVGKSVSLIQVLAALAVLITTLILAGFILNGSVRGTFISLGRNPLSRDSILTGLARIIVLAVVILGVGIGGSYLIMLV